MAGRIDTFLKLSIIASAFIVAASAAYYYLVFLPQRDAQLVMERKLERAGVEALRREQAARAEAEKSAVRERMLSERRALDARFQCLGWPNLLHWSRIRAANDSYPSEAAVPLSGQRIRAFNRERRRRNRFLR